MGFNYGVEKRKFDRVWEKLHREYIEAGMDETAILSMYEFDWETFKKERTYRNHTQPIPEQRYEDDGDSAGDDNPPLMDKFHDRLSTKAAETDPSRRMSWLDEIENEQMVSLLQKLSDEDKEILTLFVFDGYTVVEIARLKAVSHQAISKKITRLKKIFEKFLKSGCGLGFPNAYPLRGRFSEFLRKKPDRLSQGSLKTEYAVIRKSWRQDYVTVWNSLSSGAPRSPVPGGAIHPTENAKLLLARR